MNPLKIAIGVGGRFHADRLANALSRFGHELTLFTTLPKSRFVNGPAQELIDSYLFPEIVFRTLKFAHREFQGAEFKMRSFGKHFAESLISTQKPFDVVIAWSSFGLEGFRKAPNSKKIVVRDSAHVELQVETLKNEYQKLGYQFPDHSEVIKREKQEYELADFILVPSRFAKDSFVSRGVPEKKIKVIPLGVDTSLFQATHSRNFQLPLRVINFGSLTLQKGIHHLLASLDSFRSEELKLTLVGHLSPEIETLLKHYPQVTHRGAVPQSELPQILKEQDVFVLPSLQDGFGMVVPQAMASGLVPIVSSAAGASELIQNKQNGFVIEPGSPEPIVKVLKELISSPSLVNQVADKVKQTIPELNWSKYESRIQQWMGELSS
jgi:glycosyltransferase involved in cell wall biosynthesis